MPRVDQRPLYPYADEEVRKVARDAYVSWHASRYSVHWKYVGKEVWVHERGSDIEVYSGSERIAVHHQATGKHQVITQPAHHEGIPFGDPRTERKILVHMREQAPSVESRPLAAYDELVSGGAQ